ncbi:DUF11 domain-containing protein [Pontixanthobacter gangjinensis]|uniref:DUF11 domain-containing protein n=1 Tax=Pontixanthobacter gangjinensis TaxID=1028742 RepID=A0A6I4SR66_9SPHN|nr:DUF11 domain-containing protein [Pontixanthobacter gangjinensis]MXO57630.1 DUF11 domain-containing protein [Pontixanthobacter gangjinensis]
MLLSAVGGLIAPSVAVAQVKRSIENPSFEANDPQGPGAPNFQIIPAASVPGWTSTTNEIELWDSGFQSVTSADGAVHAEMNANRPGALYQNVCLVNGERIRWRFAHRKRAGGLASQTAIFQIASSTGAVIQNLQTSVATNAAAWDFRANTTGVTYTGPSGVQRMQFVTTDAGSVGNFLDDIQITLGAYIEFDPAATSAVEGAVSPNLTALRVTGAFTSSVNVKVNVTGGTATLGSDYTTPSGTNSFVITIPAGDYQSARIPLGLSIVQDGSIESSETIQLSITPDPSNFVISSTTSCGGSANTSAVHTIVDDDVPPTAVNDTATGVNGFAGNTSVLNVLTGDTVNGGPATTSNAILSVAPASSLPSQLTFDSATGVVGVKPNTPAGVYSFNYQICDVLNPTVCRTANASVTVAPSVDLSIKKTNTPGVNGDADQSDDAVFAGSTTTYSLTATNSGPDSATGAVVTDAPGVGITCASNAPVAITGNGVPAGSFTFSNLAGSGITLGMLASGQSAILTYSCQVN